jgi:hypothetical protein
MTTSCAGAEYMTPKLPTINATEQRNLTSIAPSAAPDHLSRDGNTSVSGAEIRCCRTKKIGPASRPEG